MASNFTKRLLILATGLMLAGILPCRAEAGMSAQAPGEQTYCDRACEILRNRIEFAGFPPKMVVATDLIVASELLPAFYEQRAYRVAWSGNEGPLPQAYQLRQAIQASYAEGLRPEDYHLELIDAALERLPQEADRLRSTVPHLIVDLDLLLTDAFLVYASHLVNGHVNPETIDPEWFINGSETDLVQVLRDALSSGRIEDALDDLNAAPHCARGLKTALARYRGLADEGGWPLIPAGAKMEKGDRGERVKLLKERLAVVGYGPYGSGSDPDRFDESLDNAVRHFQEGHGLEVDGIVGRNTIAELNVTAAERARQIMVNMERWRWLPRDLGERYLMVNVANFEVRVFEAEEQVMSMRAIVGRNYRRTPVFSDVMTYLVINPYWNVPNSIAVKDKLPILKEDRGYLAENNMKVFASWAADAPELDPDTIDWEEFTEDTFPLRLRQDPGPSNALGRIKFMFPNKFNVYLHDTPARTLFDQTVRNFSSGCIRIDKPLELAEYLLRADPAWSRPAILAAIDRNEEQTVRLPEPIRVYILYCTAWVDDDGQVQFRRDIYGRDAAVAEALGVLAPRIQDPGAEAAGTRM
jgi:murein L,D-transpeptidase YcbB/YkuD